MKPLALICVVGAVVVMHVRAASAHGLEMLLGSTAKGAGALTLAYEFNDQVVVTESVSIGGTTLYTSLYPGFEWLQADDPAAALYALKVGTQFSMQIVHIDQGVVVMVGSTTLSADGQSAFVAKTTNVPDGHFHPQWELLLPSGVTGAYVVSFRLTTTSHSYTQSQVYSLTVTNVPPLEVTATPTATPTAPVSSSATPMPPTPRPTATVSATASAAATSTWSPSPSATVTPPALAGDANCDVAVTAADFPAVIALIISASQPACGADANHDTLLDQQDIDATTALLFDPELP